MKCLVKEIENEGLASFLGKRVTIFCGVFIYTGKMVGCNETCVKLEDAFIVYETGGFTEKNWKDAQKLPYDWYVQTRSIESFGPLK